MAHLIVAAAVSICVRARAFVTGVTAPDNSAIAPTAIILDTTFFIPVSPFFVVAKIADQIVRN
jgi:hypothetical protein